MQKNHEQIYREFFSRNPLVVSTPSILLWTPIYSVGFGGLSVSGKLPGRHYVGIRKKENGNGCLVKFVSQKMYFPEEDSFKEKESITYYSDKVGKIYDNFLRQRGIKEGVEIEILEEGPVARGWHSTQAVCSAVSAAIFLWYKLCEKEEIANWKTMASEKLIEDEKFSDLVRLTWKAASYALGTFDDGYAILNSLIDSHYPMIFYHEKDPGYFDQYKDLGIDNPNSYYNFAEQIKWRAVRLEELFSLPEQPSWVLEYAIVYSGGECPLSHIYQAQIKYDERLSGLADFIRKTFEKTVPKSFKERPYFLEPSYSEKESPGIILFKKYRESSVVLSSEFIKRFYELYRIGYVTDRILEFFKAINLCETFAKVLGQVSPRIDNLCSILTRMGKEANELGVGAKLISEGILGDILVVGPYQSVRKTIEKAQDEVQRLIGQPLYCEYASWCDGEESEGVKIEQMMSENIYSAFISPQTYIIREINADGEVASSLVSFEEYQKGINTFDLLGDSDEKKIYIKGNLLSSSDIHSTKATLETLNRFFEKQRIQLSARELDSSSYSDRNQMESKIVRPLVAAFKKYTGKKLNLVVSGGLGTNYSLTLDPNGHKIGLIGKK